MQQQMMNTGVNIKLTGGLKKYTGLSYTTIVDMANKVREWGGAGESPKMITTSG